MGNALGQQKIGRVADDQYDIVVGRHGSSWETAGRAATMGYFIGTARGAARPPQPRPSCHVGYLPVLPYRPRSEEQTSELQSLMRISYAVLCLKKKTNKT